MCMHSSFEVVWYNANDGYPYGRNDITHNLLTIYSDTVLDALVVVYYLIITITLQARYHHHSCITDDKT